MITVFAYIIVGMIAAFFLAAILAGLGMMLAVLGAILAGVVKLFQKSS